MINLAIILGIFISFRKKTKEKHEFFLHDYTITAFGKLKIINNKCGTTD